MVIISQDLDEIFVLADRIAVIAGGRLSEPVPTRDATVESIGRLMGGATADAWGSRSCLSPAPGTEERMSPMLKIEAARL